MRLTVLPGPFALCRLPPDQEVPSWALRDRGFLSITYTAEELSVACPSASVPSYVQSDRGWVAIKVEGPLDLSLTGILASLAHPLAEAGIPIFAVSTYDTDYLLVRQERLSQAREVLEDYGHQFL